MKEKVNNKTFTQLDQNFGFFIILFKTNTKTTDQQQKHKNCLLV